MTLSDQWRDISEAPKDGTPILLGRFGHPDCKYNGRIRVDRWRTSVKRDGYTGFGHFNDRFWPATHFAHLPPPPHSEGNPKS